MWDKALEEAFAAVVLGWCSIEVELFFDLKHSVSKVFCSVKAPAVRLEMAFPVPHLEVPEP